MKVYVYLKTLMLSFSINAVVYLYIPLISLNDFDTHSEFLFFDFRAIQ